MSLNDGPQLCVQQSTFIRRLRVSVYESGYICSCGGKRVWCCCVVVVRCSLLWSGGYSSHVSIRNLSLVVYQIANYYYFGCAFFSISIDRRIGSSFHEYMISCVGVSCCLYILFIFGWLVGWLVRALFVIIFIWNSFQFRLLLYCGCCVVVDVI